MPELHEELAGPDSAFPAERKFQRALPDRKEPDSAFPVADMVGKAPNNALPEYKNLRIG